MPLVRVTTSIALDEDDDPKELLRQLSSLVADHTQKEEDWVMTAYLGEVPMTFGGLDDPACLVEVTNVGGFDRDGAAELVAAICELVAPWLDVPPERIYVSLADAKPELWGWNGETFAEE